MSGSVTKQVKKLKKRCFWLNLDNPLYVEYHDHEWGRPVHSDQKLFEMLTLEGAQAGPSWETILNKRENYRRAFQKFDPKKVAKFTTTKKAALMKNEGIVRNRLKIDSTIGNAKAFLAIQKEFGSFDKYIWKFNDAKVISKDLKKRGFRFIGPTIIYAFMQACGMVNDHSKDCYLYPEHS